jgi:hypothetical protein
MLLYALDRSAFWISFARIAALPLVGRSPKKERPTKIGRIKSLTGILNPDQGDERDSGSKILVREVFRV